MSTDGPQPPPEGEANVVRPRFGGKMGGGKHRPIPADFCLQAMGLSAAGEVIIRANDGSLHFMQPDKITKAWLIARAGLRNEMLWRVFGVFPSNWQWPTDPAERGYRLAPRFSVDEVQSGLARDAERIGTKGPEDFKGRGAHLTAQGHLVLNTGKALRVYDKGRGRDVPVGLFGAPGQEQIFTGGLALPPPIDLGDSAGAGRELLALIGQFKFKRQRLDALLVLGAFGQGFIGGALAWRAHVWISGSRGAGKTTLGRIQKALLGRWLWESSDASAPAIYRALQHDSLAVQLDEQGDSSNPYRMVDLVQLARSGSGGNLAARAGLDGKAQLFILRSAMTFLGVNVPPLEAQDRSRFCIIEMLPHDRGSTLAVMAGADLAELGQAMLGRLALHFRRLVDQVLPDIRAHLTSEALGFDARQADTIGTLLAIGWVMQTDQPFGQEDLGDLFDELRELLAEHQVDEKPDQQRCLDHLLASQVDVFRRGERTGIGTLLLRASGLVVTDKAEEASRELSGAGLRIIAAGIPAHEPTGKPAEAALAIANWSPVLGEIFGRTRWAGEASHGGGWKATLRRFPGAMASPEAVRFAGYRDRATLLPLRLVVDGLSGRELPVAQPELPA